MTKIPKAITDMSTLARVIFDPDTIPPSIPTGIVTTPISSSRIDITWLASTDAGGSGVSGYLVYRNSVQIASTNQLIYSDTGLAPNTAYQYQVAAFDGAGNVSSLSTIVSGTTQANAGPPVFAPTQPAIAFCGIAGVRTYTDPIQQAAIGRYNLFVLGISWEGWANSGRDMDTGVVKPIKAASTAPGGTVLLNYVNLNAIEEDANDPRPTWTAEVAARNWRLYITGSSGTLVTPNNATGSTALVNYTDFVPVNPSLEHPYDFGAKYSYNMCLTKSKSDSRFTGLNAGLASSSLDGVFQDNFVLNPQVNGDWNRDGTTEGQGWPSTASPWLAAGQLRYVTTMRSLAPTKYVVANAGDYGVTSAGVMVGKLDGLLTESYMGKSWSWETSLPWTTVRDYYYRALSSAANPRMVFFGGSWPDTNPDGSALVRLPTAGGFPPQNTQWQWARYIAATAYLGEGLPAINRFSQGYSGDLAALDWYDFAGGVNGLVRSWLGAPIDTLRPTTPKVAKGPIGLFGVEYTNGMVLVNPKGNGTQTVVNADIPGSWKFLTGTQDPTRDSGASFSSISIPERDGLFLLRANQAWTFSDLVTGWNLLQKEDDGGTGNGVVWTSDATGPYLKYTSVKAGTCGLRYKVATTGLHEICVQYDIRRHSNNASKQCKTYGWGQANNGPATSNSTFGPTMGGYSGTSYGVYYGDVATGSNDVSVEYATSGYPTNNLPSIGFGSAFSRTPYPTQATTVASTQDITGAVWETWMVYFKASSPGVADGEIAIWKNSVLVMHMTNMWNCSSTTQDRGGFALYEYSANSGFQEDYRKVYAMFARPVGMGI